MTIEPLLATSLGPKSKFLPQGVREKSKKNFPHLYLRALKNGLTSRFQSVGTKSSEKEPQKYFSSFILKHWGKHS